MLRKIKRGKGGNKHPRTEKQMEALRRNGTLVMLTKNPMKNPDIAKSKITDKHRESARALCIKRNLLNNPRKKGVKPKNFEEMQKKAWDANRKKGILNKLKKEVNK